jgi:hypothetical protein
MITLIGSRCKHSNVFSRGVLISRFLLGNLKTKPRSKKFLFLYYWGTVLKKILTPSNNFVRTKFSQSEFDWVNLNPLRVINNDYTTLKLKVWFWWFDAVVTPVPIPNTEVKCCSGDDSPSGQK